MTRQGDWFQTYPARKRFYILDPRPEDFDIRDIAHALALKCRYGGHCAQFYSVAEHSVVLSHLVPPPLAYRTLMHDAAETYTGDIMKPIKESIGDEWKPIEARIDIMLGEVFGYDSSPHPLIKEYDSRILTDERRVLQWPPLPGKHYGDRLHAAIRCLPWQEAEAEFLARFEELREREAEAVIEPLDMTQLLRRRGVDPLTVEEQAQVQSLAAKLAPERNGG